MDTNTGRPIPWIFWVLLVSVLIVLGQSMYKNYVAKNYSFYIEALCDPAVSECYTRDCSTGDCPPNNLSVYSVYRIPASLFSSCADNGCTNFCRSGGLACESIPCSSQTDVECAGLRPSQ